MIRLLVHIYFGLVVGQSLLANFSVHNMESLNNQLSNNAILCMYQDSYGFMWFGTYDGLNLYNGKEVTTFRFDADNPHSLSGNSIHNITTADETHLWIATQLGLDRFSITKRRVEESYPEYKKASLIASDSKGNTWIIYEDNQISYYLRSERKFMRFVLDNVNRSHVKSLFLNKEEQPCIVKENGVIQYIHLETEAAGKPETYRLITQEKSFHNKKIGQVFYEDGMIYFVDEEADLLVYDYLNQQKILIRNIGEIIRSYGIISSLCFFQNEIYFAFLHSGLVKIDPSNHTATHQALNTSIGMFGLMKDHRQEAFWIGTDGEGVGLYYREKEKFGNVLLNQLPFTARRPIRTFYTDEQNSLWIGTKGDGIIRIKKYDKYNSIPIPHAATERFLTQVGISESPVYCFVRSIYNTNDLWIGTDGNISYYSYKDQQLSNVVADSGGKMRNLTNVHTLCEVNDSTLWVSSLGLHKVTVDKTKTPYRIKRQQKYLFKKENRNIEDEFYSMVFDGDSTLFLGSRGGYGIISLNIYTEAYRFLSMDKAHNKPIGDVISLYLDDKKRLYAGASSGFIQIKDPYHKDPEIKQFNRNSGIINDMIHGILKDKTGILWLSTNKGLVKYNPANESFFNVNSPRIAVSEYSDGAYWHCPLSDRLFFGGVNGFTWIEPHNGDEPDAYEPELLFAELNHFGKITTLYDYNKTPAKRLKIPFKENTFEITFAVLDYLNGENYDYSYRLEHHHTHWIALQKENKITFTNLPSGEYILKVKYRNDVLQTADKIYTLSLIILPPWYLSLFAYLIYVALFILLAIYVVYYIKRKFRQKHELVARKIKEEQKEKLYESKMRFFTNITHELYTPLTLINGALEQLQKEASVNGRMQKYIRIFQNNVLSLNELIKEILEYRKIEESEGDALTLKAISIPLLLNAILPSFAEIAKQNRVDFVTSVPQNTLWSTDSACFKKIVSNLLSNAFKYTPVGGLVKFSVFVENERLMVEVYNTGKGIEPDKVKYLFSRYRILENADVNSNNQMTARNGLGLFICHSMTKLLQGEITVESQVDSYVKFSVSLPDLLQKNTLQTEASTAKEPPMLALDKKGLSHKLATSDGVQQPCILIVDDNGEMVEMVSDILCSEYRTLKAYNAHEALLLMKSQTPSLIITDIMMPELDGLSFIQMVRHNKFTKHLPIVALSAKTDQTDQIKGYEAGADAYITKPFSAEMLLSIVSRFLTNKEELKEFYDSAESYFEYTGGQLLHQEEKEFIDQILNIIHLHINDTKLGPEFIANKMKITSRTLHRQLKRILSVTTSDFIKNHKLSYAARLLISSNLSVKEIIHKVGISNKSYFYREFLKKYGTSPKQYREENQKDIST